MTDLSLFLISAFQVSAMIFASFVLWVWVRHGLLVWGMDKLTAHAWVLSLRVFDAFYWLVTLGCLWFYLTT